MTRFITDVSTVFNPFSPRSKTARLFLSFLPPNARQTGMKVTTKLLPRASKDPSFVQLKFSKNNPILAYVLYKTHLNAALIIFTQRTEKK
jgi:large subunit ribosomal protein L53